MKKIFCVFIAFLFSLNFYAQDAYLENIHEIQNVTEIEQTKAEILIDSNIHGAEVYINGEYKGRTKLCIKDLVPSVYRIQIKRKGYIIIDSVVEVRQGVLLTYNFTLEKSQK